MLDETTMVQKLAAEALGTAFLVFIGVGSVPATLIVNGDAPFTMADLGMISLAFGTIVIATVYALGHIGGNHINPAVTFGLAVSGKLPLARGAGVHRRAGRRRHRRRDSRSRGPRPQGHRRRLGVTSFSGITLGSGHPRRGRRHVHPGVHDLRRRSTARPPPASPASSSAGRVRRSSRWPRSPARRSTPPARSVRCSVQRSPAGTCTGVSVPVYLAAESSSGRPWPLSLRLHRPHAR